MSAMLEYTAKCSDSGKSVEKILKREFGVSSKLMKELKLSGKIFLNGTVCRSVDIVSEEDRLCADISEEYDATAVIVPKKADFEVLFEDDCILVINKPGGMESHPSLGNNFSTLANAVMYYWEEKGEYHNYHIANRLDKDTSGLCVVAKNRYAHSRLAAQLAEKSFKRKYTAIVHGTFCHSEGTIELPIARDCESIIKRRVDPVCGKYAKTAYCAHEIGTSGCSIADIELMTGRTHQIRVHFSHINHSLVGDWLYGNGDNERELIGRQALHAGYMEFTHPVTCERMSFSADMPEDMKRLIDLLKM